MEISVADGIDAVVFGDVIVRGDKARDQRSGVRVFVELHTVIIAGTHNNHTVGLIGDTLVGLGRYPCLRLLGVDAACNRAQGIDGVECHLALIAVQGYGHQRPGGRKAYARNILDIGIGQGQILGLALVHLIAVDADARIGLTCHGILVAHRTGVECILILGGAYALILRQAVHGYGALVVAYVAQDIVVRRPRQRIGGVEFLLVHPIGCAVDYLIGGAVLGDGYFRAVVQFLDIDVVFAYEGYHTAVG